MKATLKTLGNCQCCGNQQAVLARGTMSNHGYTVENGWFNGVCPGNDYLPLQQDRSRLDLTVNNILNAELPALAIQLKEMKAGKILPTACKSGPGFRATDIPFAQGTKGLQDQAINRMIHDTESRIRAGQLYCKDMLALADRVHGQPLTTVTKGPKGPRIQTDDKRLLGQTTVTCKYQDKGRVYYTFKRSDGTLFSSWMGTQAWRKLPQGE